jgi:hypothetical protein
MKSKVAVLLLTFALAAWCAAQAGPGAQAEQITNGPTVEGVTANSATIAWSTNTGGSSVVRYGTDPNNLNQTGQSPWAAAGQTHRVQLSNLQPGKTYYYQVLSAQGQGTGTGALSNVAQFNTPASGQAGAALGQSPGQMTSTSGARIPVYRAANAASGSHLFTTNAQEAQSSPGFSPEGISFYIDQNQSAGDVALYHLVGPNGDNFYTADAAQRNSAMAAGYRDAGVLGYISSTQQSGTVPLYRIDNPKYSVNFYTTNVAERDRLIAAGWRDQGTVGYVWQR